MVLCGVLRFGTKFHEGVPAEELPDEELPTQRYLDDLEDLEGYDSDPEILGLSYDALPCRDQSDESEHSFGDREPELESEKNASG